MCNPCQSRSMCEPNVELRTILVIQRANYVLLSCYLMLCVVLFANVVLASCSNQLRTLLHKPLI